MDPQLKCEQRNPQMKAARMQRTGTVVGQVRPTRHRMIMACTRVHAHSRAVLPAYACPRLQREPMLQGRAIATTTSCRTNLRNITPIKRCDVLPRLSAVSRVNACQALVLAADGERRHGILVARLLRQGALGRVGP